MKLKKFNTFINSKAIIHKKMSIPTLEQYHDALINIKHDDTYTIQTNNKYIKHNYRFDMNGWKISKPLKNICSAFPPPAC